MKKIITIWFIMLVCCSCFSFQKKRDICFNEYSILCEVANRNNVDLSEVGNVIRIANAVMITKNKYTAKDALKVLKDIKSMINGVVCYSIVYSEISKLGFKYPELFIVMDVYMKDFNSLNIITPFDQKILNNYIDLLIYEMEFLISLK